MYDLCEELTETVTSSFGHLFLMEKDRRKIETLRKAQQEGTVDKEDVEWVLNVIDKGYNLKTGFRIAHDYDISKDDFIPRVKSEPETIFRILNLLHSQPQFDGWEKQYEDVPIIKKELYRSIDLVESFSKENKVFYKNMVRLFPYDGSAK